MLLLYPPGHGVMDRECIIYIPLCFYFIGCIDWWRCSGYNLHSTMLLLYHVTDWTREQLLVIYIPLCFYFIHCHGIPKWPPHIHLHSTMLLLYLGVIWILAFRRTIYIPLCFYFIRGHCADDICCLLFTFHYASTLSFPYSLFKIFQPDLHSTMLLLYQCWSATFPRCCPDLHSTMLLLYRETSGHFRCNVLYLHSTMLLLYLWSRRRDQSLPTSFTFHYASTLSCRNHCKHCGIVIYIPLCFYFIWSELYNWRR